MLSEYSCREEERNWKINFFLRFVTEFLILFFIYFFIIIFLFFSFMLVTTNQNWLCLLCYKFKFV